MKNYLALFSLLICLVSIACSLSGSGQIGGAQATDVPQVVSAVQSTPTAPLATTATSAVPPALTPTHTPASQSDPTGTVSSESFVSPGATQTPAPTSTPTPTRTPTHTATPQAIVGRTLPTELYFHGGGAGGFLSCGEEYEKMGVHPPFYALDFAAEIMVYCFYGLPLNEEITLTFYGPNGNYLASSIFIADEDSLRTLAGESVGDTYEWEGRMIMQLYSIVRADIPQGEWSATAQSRSIYIDGTFDVFLSSSSLPVVTLGYDQNYDPFSDPCCWENFSVGDYVLILGTGFGSRQSINLGFYYRPGLGIEGPLVFIETVVTDNNGDFKFKWLIRDSHLSGEYRVLFATENFEDLDFLRSFHVSGTPAQINCPGAAQTRLNIGFYTRITFTDGTPSRLRDLPASANVLASLPEGTAMRIMAGPECHNQLVWWQVETYDGLTGWLAEGRPGDYWLEPLD